MQQSQTDKNSGIQGKSGSYSGNLSSRAESSISNLVGSKDRVGEIRLQQLAQQKNIDHDTFREVCDYAFWSSNNSNSSSSAPST